MNILEEFYSEFGETLIDMDILRLREKQEVRSLFPIKINYPK